MRGAHELERAAALQRGSVRPLASRRRRVGGEGGEVAEAALPKGRVRPAARDASGAWDDRRRDLAAAAESAQPVAAAEDVAGGAEGRGGEAEQQLEQHQQRE